jgi:hypothetical protein
LIVDSVDLDVLNTVVMILRKAFDFFSAVPSMLCIVSSHVSAIPYSVMGVQRRFANGERFKSNRKNYCIP